VLLTTHDSNLAYEWADEVLVLDQGRPALAGAPLDVFAHSETIQSYRLAQPAVMEIWQRTFRDDWCGAPPRTRSELVDGIKALRLVGKH